MTYRWESSLWLNGRQIYLGGFATEEEAARSYDLAALGCKGPTAETNFPAADYAAQLSADLAALSPVRACCIAPLPCRATLMCPITWPSCAGLQEEVISWVRRRSNAFARGKSRFREGRPVGDAHRVLCWPQERAHMHGTPVRQGSDCCAHALTRACCDRCLLECTMTRKGPLACMTGQ